MIFRSILSVACATLFLLGCEKKNKDAREQPSLVAESQVDSVEINNNVSQISAVIDSILSSKETSFQIPKNIDRDLFVVAFYNEANDCQEAIIYNNAKKKSASKITYYHDGTTSISKLVPESDGSFREIYEEWQEDRPHYVIYPAIVKFIHTNGSIGATFPVLSLN